MNILWAGALATVIGLLIGMATALSAIALDASKNRPRSTGNDSGGRAEKGGET